MLGFAINAIPQGKKTYIHIENWFEIFFSHAYSSPNCFMLDYGTNWYPYVCLTL